MRIPFSVQGFLISQEQEEHVFMLFQRNARSELGLPRFWQGVSGALEPGECFTDAAIREVREENAIDLPHVLESGFSNTFPIRDDWHHLYGPEPTVVQERIFYAFVPPGTTPTLSSEHRAWRWCHQQEALRLLNYGANQACLLSVLQKLIPEPPNQSFSPDARCTPVGRCP